MSRINEDFYWAVYAPCLSYEWCTWAVELDWGLIFGGFRWQLVAFVLFFPINI